MQDSSKSGVYPVVQPSTNWALICIWCVGMLALATVLVFMCGR